MKHQATALISPPGGEVTDLATRAAGGDREAFAALYNEHRDVVYLFIARRTGDRLLAEDLTSETFIRALRRIDTFSADRSSGRVGAWLVTIARNLISDHFKSARVQRELLVSDIHDDAVATVRSAETVALRNADYAELVGDLKAAMDALNSYQRATVRMRFLEGLSGPETAARLGKTSMAVKMAQHRAMAVMQQTIRSRAALRQQDGAAA
ncbi:sigma-70 family RNA polymerase sigma factor [Streptomyces sp. NPDC014748]|uniref:sigma-70 family RNA polymerase sigma factor n=1 Tax=unclassified Streptomyces TaxID=2593676 RepID=UPI0037009AB8